MASAHAVADTAHATEAPWHEDELRLLSVENAAEFLGMSRSRMYELLAAREVASVKIGRSRRVPLGALRRYVSDLLADQSHTAVRLVPATKEGKTTDG